MLDADRQRAELMAWYGRFCQEQGHHRRAIRWCTLAVEAAESVGDKAVMADALRVMDWAAMDLGKLDRPDNLERALALFEELGDLPGTAGVLNMLGGLAYYKGDWEQASALYLRAQATVRRTGNAVMDAFYVFNLGEIARDQGHLDEAERALTSALRTWRAAGYRSGTGYAKGMLARVATGQHRYDDAQRLFEEAIEELSDIGSRGEVLEVQAGLAECLLLSGDTAGALSLADETISQAHALGGMAPQIPDLHRVRGAALAARRRRRRCPKIAAPEPAGCRDAGGGVRGGPDHAGSGRRRDRPGRAGAPGSLGSTDIRQAQGGLDPGSPVGTTCRRGGDGHPTPRRRPCRTGTGGQSSSTWPPLTRSILAG